MSSYILVIDEGTTSTRAIAYNRALEPVAVEQKEVPLTYPEDGWVEQDGEMIWDHTLEVCRDVIAKIGGAGQVAGIGITNQRENDIGMGSNNWNADCASHRVARPAEQRVFATI